MGGSDLNIAPADVDFYWTNAADPYSLHSHGNRPPPSHNGHIKRFQGTPLRLEVQRGKRGRFVSQYKSLPAVPIIQGLVLRKADRRAIHIRTLSWLLRRSFVALEWFRFERTISPESQKQLSFDQGMERWPSLRGISNEANAPFPGFQLHLLPSLPKTLHQFSFTQWEIPKVERADPVKKVGTEISEQAQAYLPLEMAKLAHRLERFCPPLQMDTAAFLRSLAELGESPTMSESSLTRMILRCSLPNSSRCRQDFAGLVISAAKAALWLPQLEVFELWGTSMEGKEGRAFLFRYICKDGRASILWRSCEKSMAAGARIIAQWSEVAQKHAHSPLLHGAVPFTEAKEDIYWTYGTCIFRHLLLEDLVFDPMTQKILENEPYGPRLDEDETDEESDSSQQGEPLHIWEL